MEDIHHESNFTSDASRKDSIRLTIADVNTAGGGGIVIQKI
jgi:hypothetical protein